MGFHKLIKKIAPRIYKQIAKLFNFPFFIHIEPSTICNLNCKMCEYSYTKNKGGYISYPQFEILFNSIKKGIPKLIQLIFPKLVLFDLTGIGESLMNKDFLKIVKLIKNHKFTATFATNFTLINEKVAYKLINSKLDLIFISLDGATKKTYEKIRRGAKFETVINNIKNFVKLRKNLKSKKPKLTIRFLASSQNIKELTKLIELSKKIGVKNISITRMNTSEKTKNLQVDPKLFELKKNEAIKLAKKLNIKADFGLFKKRLIQKCKRAFNSMYITCQGGVLPCCFVNQGGEYEKIKKLYNLGNAFKQDLKLIWNSSKYRSLRKMIQKGFAPPICKNCYLFYELES